MLFAMRNLPRNTVLYNQALEILNLSRHISHYLLYDMAHLQANDREHPQIYFTGDIIRQSDSLAPEIIKAESEPFQDDRLRRAASLKKLSDRLYMNCQRLERVEGNGKDFLKLLRLEIKKFKKLQRKWMLTL